ncbi:MAG: hypothetical protein EON61_04695 [Alphaproteobacteria bacterium]|nr:MAG: hypothetical protein EON61_04695 [Alphaproteobacteria bacterium]
MEIELQPKVFDSEIGHQLTEYLLIHADLTRSLASLTLWAKKYSTRDVDAESSTIVASLFRDGITQFVSCFDGPSNSVPLVVEEVYPNTEGIAPYFVWLRALRNRFTAHRFGAARQCVVGVVIHPENGELIALTPSYARYSGPSPEGHADLLGIVQMALQFAAKKVEDITAAHVAELNALSAEQRLALPRAEMIVPGPSDMKVSRGDIVRLRKARQSGEPTDQ